LRIEPYQGIERVELIHDVLTPVVRQERERQREYARQAEVEAEAAKQRQRQRVRLLTGSLTVLVAVLLGVGYLAFWAYNQKMLAEARQMAAIGAGRLDVDPELAALIALESLNVEPTVQGESLLRQALVRTAQSVLRGQEQAIQNVAFNSDGRKLAMAAEDGSVLVWDLKTSQILHRLDHGKAKVRLVKFSSNGKLLATGDDNARVWLWDEASGSTLHVLSLQEQSSRMANSVPTGVQVVPDTDLWATAIVFGPDGQWLGAGWSDGRVALWDLSNYSLKRVSDTKADQPIVGIAFSKNGRDLIAANDQGQLYNWQLDGRQQPVPRFSLKLDRLSLNAIAPSPDGKHLVVAAGREDPKGLFGGAKGSVKIIDAATGNELRELRGGHNGAVLDAVFSPDGRIVITSASDGTICVWDAKNGDLKRNLRGHVGAVRSVSVAGDNTVLASGGDDRSARIWSVSTLPSIVLKGHEGQATAVAFSPDGRWLVSGGMDKTVRVWKTSDGKEVRTLADHRDEVYIVAVSPDGRLIASGGGDMIRSGRLEGDTAIRLWDRETGELHLKIQNRGDVFGAAFTPDGRELASTGADPAVRFWDVATGQMVRTFQWQQEAGGVGLWLSVSPDGKNVAIANSDGIARVWDYTNGALLWKLTGSKEHALTSGLFSDNGKLLMTTSIGDPEIIVWDMAKGSEIRRFKGYAGINLADWSRDGTLAVTADSGGPPWLWDVRTGTPLVSLYAGANAWGVAFSADGRRIATTSMTGEIYLWDCTICVPVNELRELTKKRIGRTLTSEELHTILGG
jgi:WD40 repeat protein